MPILWKDPKHAGCQVCIQYLAARQTFHAANVDAIYAASLRVHEPRTREGGQKKQETPRPGRPEVSTPAASRNSRWECR